MTLTLKHIMIIGLTLAAIGIATWTTLLSFNPKIPAQTQSVHLPDALMENVVAVIMDKQGKPSMKIVTPKLMHFAEDNTTDLSLPEITLYRKSPNPWYITAKYAKAVQGIEVVNFWDNVAIHHAADSNHPATLIKTNTLVVHPNQKIADTHDLITMVQPDMIVKAIGMHADMNSGDINLLSQARGEYAPHS